jgi:hypothetical protein
MNNTTPEPIKSNYPSQELIKNDTHLRRVDLREQRTQELLEKCQQEILQQIIGPFGLTPMMFTDINGGMVTTTHNFSNGIAATDEDKDKFNKWQETLTNGVNRTKIDAELKIKRKKLFKNDTTPTSAYTGKELTKDGQTHLDHVIPVDQYEKSSSANLFQTAQRRQEILNSDQNLVPTEASINMSMGKREKQEWENAQRKKDPGKTNGESFGIDSQLLNETVTTAERHIQLEQFKDQAKKQGIELATTGANVAVKQALRQAMGVLLHEFANHSFIEVKRLILTPVNQDNFLDELIESLRKVAERVIAKLRNALDALISGGTQGFVSNLLTFLINNFVTTAAKVVTMIREGMSSLWSVIKLLANPPEQMSSADIARQATKIIVSSLTVAFGLIMEESVKTFILTIPFLIPIAEVLSTGLTAILTGLLTALMVYGIDRLFDAMQSKGTELLEAMEANADSQANMVLGLADLLEKQVTTAKLYETSITNYKLMHGSMTITTNKFLGAAKSSELTGEHRASTIQTIQDQTAAEKFLQSELDALLTRLEQRK